MGQRPYQQAQAQLPSTSSSSLPFGSTAHALPGPCAAASLQYAPAKWYYVLVAGFLAAPLAFANAYGAGLSEQHAAGSRLGRRASGAAWERASNASAPSLAAPLLPDSRPPLSSARRSRLEHGKPVWQARHLLVCRLGGPGCRRRHHGPRRLRRHVCIGGSSLGPDAGLQDRVGWLARVWRPGPAACRTCSCSPGCCASQRPGLSLLLPTRPPLSALHDCSLLHARRYLTLSSPRAMFTAQLVGAVMGCVIAPL